MLPASLVSRLLPLARREPLYLMATAALLSLGIAALGAMLALHRGTLAQPPPLSHWDRLAVLRGVTAQAQRLPLSFPDFEDLRRDIAAFEDLALTRTTTVTLQAGDDTPLRVAGARVTPNLPAVLGIVLHGGAGFDVAVGATADQLVISDRLWRGLLGGQPLDRIALRIGGRAVEVVGVLPPGVRFPTPDVDLWMPLAPVGNEARRDYAFATPWALLRHPSDLDTAQRQLAQRSASLAREFPQSHAGLRVEPIPVEGDLFAAHRPIISLFALVGALVLVAVAGNLAALSAARELARIAQTRTRLAVGATGARLVREAVRAQVVPTAIASLAGGLLAWAIVVAAEASDGEVFTALRASVDPIVIVGTVLGLSVLVAAQFAPIVWMQVRIGQGAPGFARTRSPTLDRGAARGAGFIVALQLAMCFATVGTLMLARASLQALERIELGFVAEERFSVALGVPELDHPATIAGFEAAIAEAARLPGLDAVGAISRLPLLRGASSVGLIPSSVGLSGEAALPVDARLVIGPAAEVLGVRLLRGRHLDALDRSGSTPSIIVDRRFVETWFPGRDPIGRRVRLQIDPTIEWSIVGIFAPVRWRSFEDGEAPSMILPAAQFGNIAPMRNAQLVWRGRFDASAGVAGLREALRRGMPLLSADTPRPLEALVAEASGQVRMAIRLLHLLTAMALLLCVLGVGALLLYRHERQRHAVGIRLCLGASRTRVVVAIVADGMVLALAGGLAGAALVATIRLLTGAGSLLPETGHAMASAVAAGVVLLLSVLGALGPAWRVARLDPAQVLRDGA
jgi:putative ABC transport system permease protein